VDWVEGLEMGHLVALQGFRILEAVEHGHVDGVFVFLA
jgi:hypothetical protein